MAGLSERQLQRLLTTMNTCGLFVTCGIEPHNVMSTHWGTIGTMWNRDVFVLPVRESKLSHEIITKNGPFAVCMPIRPQPTIPTILSLISIPVKPLLVAPLLTAVSHCPSLRYNEIVIPITGSLTLNHLKISRKARNGFIFCQI